MDKRTIIELNMRLNMEFNTTFSVRSEADLDHALTLGSKEKIAEHIIKNHPFVDGNKRTGVAVMLFRKDIDSTVKKNYWFFQLLASEDIKLLPECGHIVSKSKSLGVCSSGHSNIEALLMLKEAVELYLEQPLAQKSVGNKGEKMLYTYPEPVMKLWDNKYDERWDKINTIPLSQQGMAFLKTFSTGKNMHKKREVIEVRGALIKQKNTKQQSLIYCDKIEYHFNHLFCYNQERLVFKVWLKKDYKNIKHALEDVGITV